MNSENDNLVNLPSGIDFHVHINPFNEEQIEYVITSNRRMVILPDLFIPELACEKGHIVRCSNAIDENRLYFTCTTCGKPIYTGSDPFRKYNEKLFQIFENYNDRIWIFPAITVTPYMLQEISYYERNYLGLYGGFKIHPNYSSYLISQLKLDSNYPILFHSGVGKLENPMLQIKFAKNYHGIVIIAHMGRFMKKCFDNAKTMNNVFFDCSAFTLLWNSYANNKSLFDTSYLGHFRDISDLISASINYLGADKIVFGSDFPYGNYEENINALCYSQLTNKDITNICQDNVYKIIKRL
jgi:predicted TIM-barrel fold metal-dependent hydrolase